MLTFSKMTRSRTSLRDSSRPGSRSPSSEEDSSDGKSIKDEKTPSRGRKGQHAEDETAEKMEVDTTA